MKYISILIIFAAFQINASAQKLVETEVPTPVKSSFTMMFNNTAVTSWEMVDGNYKANYMQAGVENAVLYTAEGKIIHYENPITARDLPEATMNYINSNLAGKKITNVMRIKTITGMISYKLKAGDVNYLFDSNGSFIK